MVRIERESAIWWRFSATVVITRLISPFFSRSTTCGRPSFTLSTGLTGMPAASSAAAVPRVATSS